MEEHFLGEGNKRGNNDVPLLLETELVEMVVDSEWTLMQIRGMEKECDGEVRAWVCGNPAKMNWASEGRRNVNLVEAFFKFCQF
jgi:hypothetical protein